jgi:competence protein ComGC
MDVPPNPAAQSEGAPTPPPVDPAPRKPAKQFGWGFWIVLVLILGLLTAITVPNFVKARTTACHNACIANLKHIDGAIAQWALENHKPDNASVEVTNMVAYLKGKQLPVCPANGTYILTTVSAKPACTQSTIGHSL